MALPFPISDEVEFAIELLSYSTPENRGAVYTRREVVEFILDLSGYTDDKPLYKKQILEPSFGNGEFLFAIIERLLKSCASHEITGDLLTHKLKDCIRAVELHKGTFYSARKQLDILLEAKGLTMQQRNVLLDSWLICDDYLLHDLGCSFDYVVGNPPYLRQELIPDVLMAEYRNRFATIFDRADLYIAFFEKSLLSLKADGVLGFICSDRWAKNRYGGPLRKLISDHFSLKIYVDMVDTPAFSSQVAAYPAITIIHNKKESSGITRIIRKPKINELHLSSLAKKVSSNIKNNNIEEIKDVADGDKPWILDLCERSNFIRYLEDNFPHIEEAGCKVGIGVATGADEIYIKPSSVLDIESTRKLPLIMTDDISNGKISWSGNSIVNPFDDAGKLVNLEDYPKLKAYLTEHEERLRNRYIAKRNPQKWYRTIDRIQPSFVQRAKLLIPDIKGKAQIIYDKGEFYPHHNLYYIVSDKWDLRALQVVLRAGIAHMFVATYSTKIRGGYLRFQAQYLRRIRIPRWTELSEDIKNRLIEASTKDIDENVYRLVAEMYNVKPDLFISLIKREEANNGN